MATKQTTTLNDLNIGDKFSVPGSKSIYQINDIINFIDEDTGDVVPLVEVFNIKTHVLKYWGFDKEVIKIN